jgi:hypothetical protein
MRTSGGRGHERERIGRIRTKIDVEKVEWKISR